MSRYTLVTKTMQALGLSLVLAAGMWPGSPAVAQENGSGQFEDYLEGLTRAELAGLYKSMQGQAFTPPACVSGSEMFDDVSASSLFCPWIEELVRRGITAGCSVSPPLYCPNDPVTRTTMAVFLIKAIESAGGGRWAVVNADGTLARGAHVVSSSQTSTGSYLVQFDTDITNCAYIATVGNPDGGDPNGYFIGTALSIGTTDTVFVDIEDATNVDIDSSFHLQAACS